MRPFGTNAGTVALSGAVLLLGGWFAYGLLTEADGSALPEGPALAPELIVVDGPRAMPGIQHQDGQRPSAGQIAVSSVAVASVQSAAIRSLDASVSSNPSVRAPAEFNAVLDRVFAPDRFKSQGAVVTPTVAIEQDAGSATAGGADVFRPLQARAVLSAQARPATTATEVDDRDAPVRVVAETEKAYHEAFVAVGKEDLQELTRQAATVLREDGEDCKKVAMLRTLYELDRAHAPDYFLQAITTLPDRKLTTGASVPAIAVNYLSTRSTDPAVLGTMERIAWGGAMNVTPELRRVAAEALVARASEADLVRYASTYPTFQAPDVALADGTR